jgi:hypothetical protein
MPPFSGKDERSLVGSNMAKSKPKPDDPEQSKRFVETAKEVEADDEMALERAFKKISTDRSKQNQG